MLKHVLITAFCITTSTYVYANTEVSTALKNALLCKNYTKIDQDLSIAAYYSSSSLQEINRLEKSEKKQYPLSKELKSKFTAKPGPSGGYGGYFTEFKPKSPFQLRSITLSVSEGIGAELSTEQIGDIKKIVDDFSASTNSKMYYLQKSHILQFINGNEDNKIANTVFSLASYLKVEKNKKDYYSNHLFIAYPKNQKNSNALTVFFTDPLNAKLVHTQCNLEVETYDF
ncbi:hypothetical protein [Acinetobacter sp.]|uniref:hypothetical protein n=1 Tax=Acinetobacter sp. TaxID=472 RepID=UPI003BB07813